MEEFFSTYQWEAWAVVALIFLVLELTAGDFFMMCLAAGAVVSSICAAVGGGFLLCLAVFAAVSVLCLVFLRPRFLKRFRKGDKSRKSNADALIGAIGTVKEEIKAGEKGYVAIDGDMWQSVSEDGGAIPKETKVEVVARESIILTVKPVNKQ